MKGHIWGHGPGRQCSSSQARFDQTGCTARLPFSQSNSSHFDASVTSHWKPLNGWIFLPQYWSITELPNFIFLLLIPSKLPKKGFFVTHSLSDSSKFQRTSADPRMLKFGIAVEFEVQLKGKIETFPSLGPKMKG